MSECGAWGEEGPLRGSRPCLAPERLCLELDGGQRVAQASGSAVEDGMGLIATSSEGTINLKRDGIQ